MKKTKEFSNRKKPKCGSLASIYKKCIYSQKKLKGQKKKKKKSSSEYDFTTQVLHMGLLSTIGFLLFFLPGKKNL